MKTLDLDSWLGQRVAGRGLEDGGGKGGKAYVLTGSHWVQLPGARRGGSGSLSRTY